RWALGCPERSPANMGWPMLLALPKVRCGSRGGLQAGYQASDPSGESYWCARTSPGASWPTWDEARSTLASLTRIDAAHRHNGTTPRADGLPPRQNLVDYVIAITIPCVMSPSPGLPTISLLADGNSLFLTCMSISAT